MNFDTFINTLLELFTTIGLKIIYAGIVLFIGLKLIKWMKKKLPSFTYMEKLDAGLRSFLCSTLAIVLYALLFISVAMIMGIPTTSFIAALASCMAAIGLAMQGSLSNFAGGIMRITAEYAGTTLTAMRYGLDTSVKTGDTVPLVIPELAGILCRP